MLFGLFTRNGFFFSLESCSIWLVSRKEPVLGKRQHGLSALKSSLGHSSTSLSMQHRLLLRVDGDTKEHHRNLFWGALQMIARDMTQPKACLTCSGFAKGSFIRNSVPLLCDADSSLLQGCPRSSPKDAVLDKVVTGKFR